VAGVLALWAFCALGLDNQELCFHLATGAWILGHRALPAQDPFAFTLGGVRWVNLSWAFQVAVAALWRAAGTAGLVAAKAILVAATAALAVGAAGRLAETKAPADATRARWLGAAALALAGPAWAPGLVMRPELAGTALLAATLWILARARGRAAWGWLALLVPLHFVWANVHASMPVGALVVGAFALRRRGGLPFAAAALALPLAWLCNPWGADALRGALPLSVAGASSAPWQSPWSHAVDLPMVAYAAWLGAAPAWLLGHLWIEGMLGRLRGPLRARARERERGAPGAPDPASPLPLAGAAGAPDPSSPLPLAGAAVALAGLAFVSLARERLAPDFLLVAAVIGAVNAGAVLRARRSWPAYAAPVAGALVAAVTVALSLAAGVHALPPLDERPTTPAGPAAFLAANAFAGRVLTGEQDGAYLAWKAGPAVQVYADPGLRDEPALRETLYRDVLPDPRRFEAEAARWGIGAVLCDLYDARFAPLWQYLDAARGRWALVYLDPSFALYLRTGPGAPPAAAALATRWRLKAMRPLAGLGYLLAPGVPLAAVQADLARLMSEKRARPLALAADGILHLAASGAPTDRLASPPSTSPELLTAIERFEAAVAARPDQAMFFYFDGLALGHAGRYADAVVALERAARLDPDAVSAWIGLYWVHRAQGDAKAADAARLQALARLPPGHPTRRGLE
jgi:hypothetical protein